MQTAYRWSALHTGGGGGGQDLSLNLKLIYFIFMSGFFCMYAYVSQVLCKSNKYF